MRSTLLVVILLFTCTTLSAQKWLTDINEAKEIAAKEHKNIVLVFSGSDWCAPCIKLEKSIFHSEEFKKYSKEKYVLVKADFPRRKKNALSKEQQAHNNTLAEKYNKKGYFPLVLVLNKKGEILGETGYIKTTPKSYIAMLDAF